MFFRDRAQHWPEHAVRRQVARIARRHRRAWSAWLAYLAWGVRIRTALTRMARGGD